MFRFASRAAAKPRAVAAVFGAAFTMRESAVYETPSEMQIAPNQRVEKQYRFSADDPAAAMKIDSLLLSTPGYTRVSYNALGRENVVRVSSDAQANLDAVEVVARGSHGLEVRVKKHNHSSGGHLLTEVFLAQPEEVREVLTAGSGVTVVEEGVLVANRPDAALTVKHSGSGKLFISSAADALVRSMEVALSGSGDVHLALPNATVLEKASLAVGSSGNLRVFTNKLDVESVSLAMAGSGGVQLATQALSARKKLSSSIAGSGSLRVYSSSLFAPTIKLSIAGSGDIRVGAQEQLTAQLVKSSVAGSGDIVVAARASQCAEHDISIAGSGDVDAGDLLVQRCKVSVLGSGDSIVQVAESLKYSNLGSGGIKHVGPAPASVSGTGRHKDLKTIYRYDSRSVLDKIADGWKAPTAIPAKEEAFDRISVGSAGASYHYHVELRSWSELVDKAAEFFGFGGSRSGAQAQPQAPAVATVATPPVYATPVYAAPADGKAPAGVPEVDLRARAPKQLEQPDAQQQP